MQSRINLNYFPFLLQHENSICFCIPLIQWFFFFFSESVEPNIFVAQVQQQQFKSSARTCMEFSFTNRSQQRLVFIGFLTWRVNSIIFSLLLVLTVNPFFTFRTEESRFESWSESLRGIFGQETGIILIIGSISIEILM